jgi:hypothetical protein
MAVAGRPRRDRAIAQSRLLRQPVDPFEAGGRRFLVVTRGA